MGMPVTVELCDASASRESLEKTFEYFDYVDATFSTYKKDSEISRINRGELPESKYSNDMKEILALAEQTKQDTNGYFNMRIPSQRLPAGRQGSIDPSGIVKGWAINSAAKLLRSFGYQHFYVEAGGDIQTSGKNSQGKEWRIGIRNPFDRDEIVKVIVPRGRGIATSGTAARGEHIYNPHTGEAVVTDIANLTVVGPNVYEADRFATAAFAMGNGGINFIQNLDGLEGYAIDKKGIATMTTGFKDYTYDQGD